VTAELAEALSEKGGRMPHYKDGTEAKLGDHVIGRGYNVKHPITGVLVQIRPGPSCNVSVMHAQPLKAIGYPDDPSTLGGSAYLGLEHGQADAFERVDLHEKRIAQGAAQ
jgi:hypothetical protein